MTGVLEEEEKKWGREILEKEMTMNFFTADGRHYHRHKKLSEPQIAEIQRKKTSKNIIVN